MNATNIMKIYDEQITDYKWQLMASYEWPRLRDDEWSLLEEADLDLLSYEFSEQPYVPLWTISSEGKKLKPKKPIKVHVYKDGEFYFAENETLDVYSVGTSVRETIENLEAHIIYFWEHYNNLSREQATGLAVKLKDIYSNLFVEE